MSRQMDRIRREAVEKYGPKPTTPAEALAHVVKVFEDSAAHQLVVTATDGIYDTTTGLTHGDLRALHAELTRLRAAADDSLDLLHVDPADNEPDNSCHWTDCPLDEGHDGPHDSPRYARPA